MTKRIILASPREPSGASWLINCFLLLNIKTFRIEDKRMWRKQGAKYYLQPQEFKLKKWLPALSENSSFSFLDDIEVQWTHDWPRGEHLERKVIFFVRDPRDALFSRYKRENSDLNYEEFIEFPDTVTLLDKITNWKLFCLSWLEHPNISIARFEDYNEDPFGTLKRILDFVNISVPEERIRFAVEGSSFERASEAERQFAEDTQRKPLLVNRGGMVGEWRNLPENGSINERITERTLGLLNDFGYPADEQGASFEIGDYAVVGFLPFYKKIAPGNWVDGVQKNIAGSEWKAIQSLFRVASYIDQDKLQRSGLRRKQREQLETALLKMIENSGLLAKKKVEKCFTEFSCKKLSTIGRFQRLFGKKEDSTH